MSLVWPRVPIHRMGDAAWPFDGPFGVAQGPEPVEGLTVPREVEGYLDLFEQPGKSVWGQVLYCA